MGRISKLLMSQISCIETCVIAVLRNLFCFIFQSLLMAIGTAFLYNVDEFKIYSTYCANHSKAQKALHQSELLISPYHLWFFIEEFKEEFQDFHCLKIHLIPIRIRNIFVVCPINFQALYQRELFNQPLSLYDFSWRNSSRNF